MRGPLVLALFLSLVACDQVYGLEGREPHDAVPDSTGEPSLVAWFTMDTIVDGFRDATGRYVGVCRDTCPFIVPGKVGGALRFDGTSAISIDSMPELVTSAAFTVAGWYYLSPSFLTTGCPFSKVYMTAANSWQLCINVNRRINYYTDGHVLPGDTIGLATWYHIVMWWDGAMKKIYVNGVETQSTPQVTAFDTGVLAIGGDFDDGLLDAPFEGSIDDLRIYNRALSVTEIVALVNAVP